MTQTLQIRLFAIADVQQVANVFHLSVSQGAASHYSEKQRAVWSPVLRTDNEWLSRLAPTVTWVAEEGRFIRGFINLSPAVEVCGHAGEPRLSAEIDCLFTHPEHVGKGVASSLYQCLESYARSRNIAVLTVEASYLAKPFFEQQGYQVLSKNEHIRADQVLVNFSMHKTLTALI